MPVVSAAVLHVTQPSDAGVARWVLDHARRQLAAGWRVNVACPPDGWLAGRLREQGVPVHPWPAQRAPHRGVAAEIRRLTALCGELHPELVHLHSSKAGLDGRLALRGHLPTVFSPHAWSFDAATGPTGRAALAWERVACRWTARLLCVSEAERDRGIAAGIAARWEVVPNGVDLGVRHRADQADRVAARASLGLPPDAPVVVCVGRLCAQKGQDLLLDAWRAVGAEHPDGVLAIVGEGPDTAVLRRHAPESVRFAGASTAPSEWFAAANVVAVPSRWEGMAFVPLEAMAAGRCVVGFDVTGMRESIPAGAGALVPAGDVAALAAAIRARLSDLTLADTEGARGRIHVEAHHDVDRLCADVLTVYERALGR